MSGYWVCRDCGRHVTVRWCIYCGRCWKCCAAKDKQPAEKQPKTKEQTA